MLHILQPWRHPVLPAGQMRRLRCMNLKDLSPTLRPAVFPGAIAAICAVAVALAVVVGYRPQIVVAAPAAVPPSTATFTPGIFAGGDAKVSKKPDTAFLTVGVESVKPSDQLGGLGGEILLGGRRARLH